MLCHPARYKYTLATNIISTDYCPSPHYTNAMFYHALRLIDDEKTEKLL